MKINITETIKNINNSYNDDTIYYALYEIDKEILQGLQSMIEIILKVRSD